MMSDRLKGQLLIAAAFIAVAFILSVLIAGTATVAGWLPVLQAASAAAAAACLLVFLPMSAFPRHHARAAFGFLAASAVLGLSLWLAGFFYTYDEWGVLGIVVGLLLLGVGVVPLAIVAQTLAGSFDVAALLALGIVLTIAARLYGLRIGAKAAHAEYERATKTITIEPNR